MAGEAAWERLCREMLCTAVRGQGAKATCGGSLGQGFGSSRLPMLPVFAWRGLAKAGGRDASMCHYARSLHFGLQKRARNCTLGLLDACSAAAAVRSAATCTNPASLKRCSRACWFKLALPNCTARRCTPPARPHGSQCGAPPYDYGTPRPAPRSPRSRDATKTALYKNARRGRPRPTSSDRQECIE